MTITLDLPPETETRLIARATIQGLSVETYLISLIEKSVAVESEETFPLDGKTEDWETALRNLGHGIPLAKAPPLSDEAISRESIYSERIDSQL